MNGPTDGRSADCDQWSITSKRQDGSDDELVAVKSQLTRFRRKLQKPRGACAFQFPDSNHRRRCGSVLEKKKGKQKNDD